MLINVAVLLLFCSAYAWVVPVPNVTPAPVLEKRDPMRGVIVNPEYQKELEGATSSSSEEQRPWVRTVYSTKIELVTPTVIGGVTFAAKPPAKPDGMEPWISLKKDGLPQTIKPQLKNGRTEKASPTYSTYFQTATTVTYGKDELKAHNMAEDQVYHDVQFIPEDDTYVKLSPLMRCTPEGFYKRGLAKNVLSEPFCTPRENTRIMLGKTHFLTWYSRYFEDAEKVRVHFAYIKEGAREKGMKKREEEDEEGKPARGAIPGTFFSSEWISNEDGYFPLIVREEWLQGLYQKKVAISIQPDTVDDEDFVLLGKSSTAVQFVKGSVVGKTTRERKEIQDSVGTDDNVYYIIMAIPTMVIIAVAGMYVFLWLNRKHRDLSKLRRPKKSRFGKSGHSSYLPTHYNEEAPARIKKH